MFAKSSPGVVLRRAEAEEYEGRGEEAFEPFSLADAGWRVGLRGLAGLLHKWAAEKQSQVLEQKQRNPDTKQDDTDGNK